MAGTQSTVPFCGLQGQQVAREPTDKRPGVSMLFFPHVGVPGVAEVLAGRQST